MTAVLPESDVSSLEDLDFEFEVACETPARRRQHGGMPRCAEGPAEWVAWRSGCCPQSPRYLLLCTTCKQTYQAWQAQGASIICADCHAETGGPIRYTPLNKKS